ncbi:Transposon Tf2-6 polyprotein [Eumeta japonica]|uniref:Transposon Tf2-6 polyprotein n=1 Tax=Eumeta variegata TaxID=151549 RepID=A0A4C1SSC2_EUMVA|nr:Transposon Tf2-6 polyprotein [Eumeta japonica]
METIEATKYSVVQLKSWLHKLGLPTNGTKNMLVSRINEVPVEKRGDCPVIEEAVDDEEGYAADRAIELLRRELAVVKKEKELLERENKLYKRMEEFEKLKENQSKNDRNGGGNNEDDNDSISANDCVEINDGAAANDSEKTNDSENTNDSERVNDGDDEGGPGAILPRNNSVQFSFLEEMLPDYDSTVAPTIFVAQLRNIQGLYRVDDGTIKALLMSKVKGKVQCWLHSKSNFVYDDLDTLLNEMIAVFGEKESKLKLRRKFELRKWKHGEDFISYFNEKVALASDVQVPEDELIDYIIDGIPDDNLRTQANLQCFITKTQLLVAFSKVTLKRRQFGDENQLANVRCYNCNCLGHYANSCQKSKREMGACYGCGSTNHLVAACPERKGPKWLRGLGCGDDVDCSTECDVFLKSIMAVEYEAGLVGDDLRVGDRVDAGVRAELERIFLEAYVRPERPPEPGKLRLILDDYLEKGYIRPSESEFASPIVLVKKKTGELRMCVDYRTLNKMTLRDNYPIPLNRRLIGPTVGEEILYQTGLEEWVLSCLCREGIGERFVNRVFADMIRDDELIVYLDDIMVATEDVKEHLRILAKVFRRLVDNRLELRLDKCEFMRTSVKYLGYEIDGKGIRADDAGVRAVIDFPVPSNVHAVRSFLGLTSYFRRFVKDFSTIAKPLTDLTRKDKGFKFGPEELRAFEVLKERLTESPILALYSPKDETELHCDASNVGFGAILLQKKDDGKMHPVFYFSKRTSEAESRYHSFELETLAILSALRRFRTYRERDLRL